MTQRRVVITGLGIQCAIGRDVETAWSSAKAGKSGAARVSLFDPSRIGAQNACEVNDFDPAALFGRDAKKLDRVAQFAVVAADEAMADSGLDMEKVNRDRAGVIAGSGIGA